MLENARFAFDVDAFEEGEGTRLDVGRAGFRESRIYRLPGGEQQDYAAFFAALAKDFGTRIPHAFADREPAPPGEAAWRPLLTDNVSPTILAGYGDPAVLKTDQGYVLVATSN